MRWNWRLRSFFDGLTSKEASLNRQEFNCMAESKGLVVNEFIDTEREICEFPECQNISKKLYRNLASKVKLGSTLFEELKDIQMVFDEDLVKAAVVQLKSALKLAKYFLQWVNEGSKLYQALQQEEVATEFHDLTERIEKALNKISLHKLNISEEVQEQIELVHAQSRRPAKERMYSPPDQQLQTDLQSAQQENDPDPSVLRRLSDKLQLRTINDLKKESLALHELLLFWRGIRDDWFVKVSLLLKRLKTYVLTENPTDTSESDQSFMKHRSPVIPDGFRCSISLQLMKDPVIVSTGQTYERSQIQKWMDAGGNTCPLTRKTLSQEPLTPNHEVKNQISKWSENNNRLASIDLLEKLATGNPEEQRTEAIFLLFELLSSTDHLSQSDALKTLRNLSAEGKIMKAACRPEHSVKN